VWKQVTPYKSIFDTQMSAGAALRVGHLQDGKIPKTSSSEASSAYKESKTAAMDITKTVLEISPLLP